MAKVSVRVGGSLHDHAERTIKGLDETPGRVVDDCRISLWRGFIKALAYRRLSFKRYGYECVEFSQDTRVKNVPQVH